jgi:uncharacterized membrane protein
MFCFRHSAPTKLALLACLAASSSSVPAQTLEGLGSLPGATFTTPNAVTDAGLVVGTSGRRPFRWENGGMTELPVYPRPFEQNDGAFDVSADGSVIVGASSFTSPAGFTPVRWTEGVLENLANPVAADGGAAVAISADGSTIVGTGYRDILEVREAFRLRDGVAQGLGYLPGDRFSYARDVSADGSVVVGRSSFFDSEQSQAFRWEGSMQLLPTPDETNEAQAVAVSADGTIAAGYASVVGNEDRAIRWVGTSGSYLPMPDGWTQMIVRDMSADGSAIVGSARVAGSFTRVAWIWTAAEGTRTLADALAGLGVEASGWTFGHATAISPDGTIVVGEGTDPDGANEAFRAVLRPSSAIVSPAADEIVPPGEPFEVRFASLGLARVDLYLVANSAGASGERTLVAEALDPDEVFEWDVPEDLLSPSTYLIAVSQAGSTVEFESERFRVRRPHQLHRIAGPPEAPTYERFTFARHAFDFDQRRENLWPQPYWDRLENAYANPDFGFDPLIQPRGAVRYDPEYFAGRPASTHPSWQAFATAFGREASYTSLSPAAFGPLSIHQVHAAPALDWRSITAPEGPSVTTGRVYSGACYGFTMATLAAFGAPEAFRERWLPSASSADLGEVGLTDDVRDAVHALFAYQYDVPTSALLIDRSETGPPTPREVLAQLRARIASDDRSLDEVLILNAPIRNQEQDGETTGLHALVPVGIEDTVGGFGAEDDGVYYVVSVDPNYGAEAVLVEIDSTASTWRHLFSDGSETEWVGPNDAGLFLGGRAQNALRPAQPFWTASLGSGSGDRVSPPVADGSAARVDRLRVRVSGGDVALVGAAGEVRFADGQLVDTLPGGAALFPITGRASQPYALVAPPARYAVELAAGAAGGHALEIGERRVLGAVRLDGTPGIPDLFAIGSDTLTVVPGQAGRMRLEARVSLGGTVRTFAADSLSAGPGDALAVDVLPDSSGFRLSSERAGTYDLALGQTGPGGRRSFYHAGVPLAPGASHTVAPDWATLGDGPVTVRVDLDGDGEPDETLELAGEGFPIATDPAPEGRIDALALSAYPNPTRASATAGIALPEASDVRAEVFDVLGRRVATLHEGPLAAGFHPLPLRTAALPAGLYVVRVSTPERSVAQRLTVVR